MTKPIARAKTTGSARTERAARGVAHRPLEAAAGARSGEKEEERRRLRELHYMKCPKCGHDMKAKDLDRRESGPLQLLRRGLLRRRRARGSIFTKRAEERRMLWPGAPSGERGRGNVPYLIDGNNLLGSWGGPRNRERPARGGGAAGGRFLSRTRGAAP